MKRTTFFISDGTGITAEALGHSLISQFDNIIFDPITIPYVDSTEKAHNVVQRIIVAAHHDQVKPLIFATLVDPNIHSIISTAPGLMIDFFNSFIAPLEEELESKSKHIIGRSHSVTNNKNYEDRMEAINYTMNNDDGINLSTLHEADIILVGVSRCGKTPTCLYLALQFGIRAANYPFTDEDFSIELSLPKSLQAFRKKCFGLSISPERLHTIREERRPGSHYASLKKCQQEVKAVETLYAQDNLPFLNTTFHSIEEIATKILAQAGIDRRW